MSKGSSNLLFDKSKPGRVGVSLPESDCPEVPFEKNINQEGLETNS